MPEEEHYAEDLIQALENSLKKVPDDLRKLDTEYKAKVERGDIKKKFKKSVKTGRGYDHLSEKELKRESDRKKELAKSHMDEDMSDSEIKINEGEGTGEEAISEIIMGELLKDPKARHIAAKASLQVSKQCKVSGMTNEEISVEVDKAIKSALKDYRRKSKLEKGMDGVLAIRDNFMG